MPVTKNSQSGFSLVELLVAIVILAVGLLGLAQLQITAIKANSQSATSTAAAALAQRYVERIASMSSDDPLFTDGASGTLDSSIEIEGAGTYDVTYIVTQVEADGTDVTKLFKVDIEVTSDTTLLHVLGKKVRKARSSTLKRTI